LDELAQFFSLGAVQQCTLLTSGLINETWRLETKHGRYIAQKLHPIFDPKVTEDAAEISNYLLTHGIPVPQFLTGKEGTFHLEVSGNYWRVMTCLPGIAHRSAPTREYLTQAGALVGRFHQALQDYTYQFQFQLPHFHDTPHIWQELTRYADDPAIQTEAIFLLEAVPTLYLPETLPRQIIHGDIKLANFLFSETGIVTGLVDLDTLMYHQRCVELGDAFRSWCTVGEKFSVEAFAAGLAGYQSIFRLTKEELSYLPQSIKLITLELGMRYAKDVIEDNYFQWDANFYPNRSAHNIARVRRQIAVYQDICRQESELYALVDQYNI
jgi:Ser/Thr protein kinase RdoA (MazF antagonist)